jgi:hypothetical protein
VAYIGNDLQVAFSTYKNIDDISGSFDGVTTSFALLVNGVAPAPLPLNSNQCLISVGGVVQRPDDTGTEGFRLSGGNIVFSSAPNTAEDFFGVILAGADYVNAGANFPDGTLAAPSITFDQDNDTGYYRSGSGAVSFASNGVAAGTWSSAGVTAPALIPTGSSVPANGVYLPAANTVGVATNGTGRLFIDASGRLLIGTSTTDTVGVGSGGAQLQSVAANPFSAARFSNDAFGCVVAIGKSRGASAGSYTVVQNNDILGEIRFAGADGTDLQTIGAQINAEVDGTPGANDLPGRLVLSTTADGASSSTERVRVTSAGRVGINTASPGSVCHVAGSNGDGLTVSGGGATGVFRSSASGTELGSTSGDNTVFLSGSGTERMRITNAGYIKASNNGSYVSVGGAEHEFRNSSSGSATARFHHAGTANDEYGLSVTTANDQNASSTYFLRCAGSSTERARIRTNGGLANYSANNANLSDRNVKKDISPAADTWDCIKEWEIVNYRYKDQSDDADLNLGVIAQQVAESCPEVITVFQEAKEATEDAPAQEERLGVKEQQMYWMAIKALQEAQVRIEALEAEMAAVKAQLS